MFLLRLIMLKHKNREVRETSNTARADINKHRVKNQKEKIKKPKKNKWKQSKTETDYYYYY